MIGVYMQSVFDDGRAIQEVDDRLRSAVGGPIEGLKIHTCFREGEGLAIFDVWESQEKFEALGSKLMPIVAELDVEISPPQFVEMIAYEVA